MKNKIITSLFITIFVFTLFFEIPIKAFNTSTHKYITATGIELFNSISDKKYNNFSKNILLNYCTKPDKDESKGLFKWHFYNPETRKNFMGESDSALTRFESHYSSAVFLYKTMQFEKSYEEFGRALHFLEDLNTPVHTNNKSFLEVCENFSFHTNFEKECEKVQFKYKELNLTKSELDNYKSVSTTSIGHNNAIAAYENVITLKKDKKSIEKISEISIKRSQKYIAIMLYKFLIDIK